MCTVFARFHHAWLISVIVEKRDRLIVHYEADHEIAWSNSIGVSRRKKVLRWNSAKACNDEFQDPRHTRRWKHRRRRRWEFNFANRRGFASHLASSVNFKREQAFPCWITSKQAAGESENVLPESFPRCAPPGHFLSRQFFSPVWLLWSPFGWARCRH